MSRSIAPERRQAYTVGIVLQVLGGIAFLVGFVGFATGGLAEVIAPETPLIDHVDADLTLHGLRIVWERNQS